MPPISPTSFLPDLVEKVFQRYEKDVRTKCQDVDTVNKDPFNYTFFTELSALFGDVLHRALHLLDEQTITVYTNEERIREIVEITEGRKSRRVIKILPNINFCLCEHFTQHVLNLDTPRTLDATATQLRSTATAPLAVSNSSRYTCEHVLALRLARLLHPQPAALREEILPNHKFTFLLKQMQSAGDID